jgi:hypothetical protein
VYGTRPSTNSTATAAITTIATMAREVIIPSPGRLPHTVSRPAATGIMASVDTTPTTSLAGPVHA